MSPTPAQVAAVQVVACYTDPGDPASIVTAVLTVNHRVIEGAPASSIRGPEYLTTRDQRFTIQEFARDYGAAHGDSPRRPLFYADRSFGFVDDQWADVIRMALMWAPSGMLDAAVDTSA
jgi:hypothetical protein